MKTLESDTREQVPAHWRSAAMPDADWYAVERSGLQGLDDAAPLQLSPALLAELQAAPVGATLLARDGDAVWRLRRLGNANLALCAAQALADSRSRVFVHLRCLLSTRLAPQLLHELRNPMNALSLHSDLLGRLLKMPNAAERAGNSARVLRERLRELASRHDALVALWLAPVQDGTEAEVSTIVASAARVVRSYGALRELRVQMDDFEVLQLARRPRRAAQFELALIAALLLAVGGLPSASTGEARELLIEATSARDGRPQLLVRSALQPEAVAEDFAGDGASPRNAAVLDELQLLLDDEPLSLHVQDGSLRFDFEPA